MNDKNDTNIMKLKSETMSNDSTKTSDTVEKHFFRASAADFKKIPGNPIAYWASDIVIKNFTLTAPLSKRIETREGLTTGSNDLFLRLWHEVKITQIGFHIKDNNEAIASKKRWFTYVKGGDFRKCSLSILRFPSSRL